MQALHFEKRDLAPTLDLNQFMHLKWEILFQAFFFCSKKTLSFDAVLPNPTLTQAELFPLCIEISSSSEYKNNLKN